MAPLYTGHCAATKMPALSTMAEPAHQVSLVSVALIALAMSVTRKLRHKNLWVILTLALLAARA